MSKRYLGDTLPAPSDPDGGGGGPRSLPPQRSVVSNGWHDIPGPGTILAGRYRIEQLLGSGGMAVVAAAYDLQLRRQVAIKHLVPEALQHLELIERFTREARAAARIRGEHVVRVIDIGVLENGGPFIVLEYLEGCDLEEHLRRNGPLPIVDAIRFVLEACEALAEAHAAQVVHRDLKPANLFLARGPDRRGHIKVLDFGVSKLLDEPMTEPSRMLGTLVYMSPEQMRAASEVDLRTDIWALGVILYELLAGTPPFTGDEWLSISRAVIEETPTPIRTLRHDVPPSLEAVLDRCLSKNPDDRHESVLELALDLMPFAKTSDRDSVRTIRGVLQGSVAPPPFDSPALGMPTVPPAAISSHAPLTTPIASLPAPSQSPAARRGSSTLPWVAAVVAGSLLTMAGRMLAAPAPPPPSAAREAAEVVVRITASAPGAEVNIDNGPHLTLPLEVSVPRDDREHTIHVHANGHLPRTETVRFTSDLLISVPLARDPRSFD